MTITTPSRDRARAVAVTGEVPAQRTAPPAAQPITAVPPQGSARTPAGGGRPAHEAVDAAQPAPVPVARPVQEPADPARPTRVAPTRAQPLRRRWPAVVGGLAAGLAVGTAGAVGAIGMAVHGGTVPAPTSTRVVAVSVTDQVANVSVPGRVLTAFGDGTWQVGVDIAPGTYATRGAVDGATCSHALRSARTGGTVAARSTTPGRATVVLTAADGWFATSGCTTWQRLG